jgi:hypothetical protein
MFQPVASANRSLATASVCVFGKAQLRSVYRLAFSSLVRAGYFNTASRIHCKLRDLGNRIRLCSSRDVNVGTEA